MKFLRRLFLTLLVLSAIAAITLNWAASTATGAAWFAKRISSSSGFKTEVRSSSLSWNCKVSLEDLRISFVPAGGATNSVVIMEAPFAEWRGCGSRKFLNLLQPRIRLTQSALGDWTPSALKDLRTADKDALPAILSEIAAKFGGELIVTDAALSAADSSGDVSQIFAGANFNFTPLKLEGHEKAAHAVFSTQRFNGEGIDLNAEWMLIDGQTIPLAHLFQQGRIAAPSAAPVAEISAPVAAPEAAELASIPEQISTPTTTEAE